MDSKLKWLVLFSGMVTTFAGYAAAIEPTGYLSFSDSPFNGLSFDYFHLDNFEDGSLNTPGVGASSGSVVGPGGLTDSVDGDDGNIDGSGSLGRSFFFGSGPAGITFTFICSTGCSMMLLAYLNRPHGF